MLGSFACALPFPRSKLTLLPAAQLAPQPFTPQIENQICQPPIPPQRSFPRPPSILLGLHITLRSLSTGQSV